MKVHTRNPTNVREKIEFIKFPVVTDQAAKNLMRKSRYTCDYKVRHQKIKEKICSMYAALRIWYWVYCDFDVVCCKGLIWKNNGRIFGQCGVLWGWIHLLVIAHLWLLAQITFAFYTKIHGRFRKVVLLLCIQLFSRTNWGPVQWYKVFCEVQV